MIQKFNALRIADRLLLAFSAVIVLVVGYVAYNQWQEQRDRNYWRTVQRQEVFNYVDILHRDMYVIGQDLEFNSQSVHVKGITFNWNDVLRCRRNIEEPYLFYSSYNSSVKTSSDKTDPFSDQWWKYSGPTPTDERECVLETNITAVTPYGNELFQQLTVGPFRFVPAE